MRLLLELVGVSGGELERLTKSEEMITWSNNGIGEDDAMKEGLERCADEREGREACGLGASESPARG